jgi:hypothetical protein
MFPLRLQQLRSSTGKLDTVVHVRTIEPAAAMLPVISFGPSGATLAIDNTFGQTLESPRLLTASSVIPMDAFSAGAAERRLGPANPPGDFGGGSGASLIAGERAQLRDQMVLQSETRLDVLKDRYPVRPTPALIAFTAQPAEEAEIPGRTETLVRMPVTFASLVAGTEVRIDPAFIAFHTEGGPSLPRSTQSGRWGAARDSGPWIFALSAPAEAGKLDPKRLSLSMDMRNSVYDVTVRRGQIRNGKVQANDQGTVVASWTAGGGEKTIDIDLEPSDIDENGWVWLSLTVTRNSEQASGNTGFEEWQFRRFDATLSGIITGPFGKPVVTWPVSESDAQREQQESETQADPEAKPAEQ